MSIQTISNRHRRRTVARDLTLGLIVTIVMVVIAVGLINYGIVVNTLRSNLETQGEEAADRLADVMGKPLRSFNTTAILQTADAFLQDSNIVGVSVWDNRDALVLDRNTAAEDEILIVKTRTIIDEGEVMGRLELSLTTRSITESSRLVLISLSTLSITIIAAIVIANRLLVARFLSIPLNKLTEGIDTISSGDYHNRLEAVAQADIDYIGQRANAMAEQIEQRNQAFRELIDTLEQRVDERTRSLSASMEISNRLSTILDLDKLVKEVVEQIKSAFDYYYVHIYLLDPQQEALKLVGGTGQEGKVLLARQHSIPTNKGLVGRAVTHNEAILVSDVTADPNWLSNPLLPATKAEIAVPITIGEEVMGVLDVQHNVIDGLVQADVELLQSIANQVAVAIQNAQRYAEAQETNRFLDSVLENLPTMLFVKDAKDLRFVRWNKAGEELVGFKREELIGKNDHDFFPKEEADFFTTKDREVLDGGVLVNIPEESIETLNQGVRMLHTRKVPIMDAEGNPRYLLGISEDITDRKKIEDQLENRVLQLNFLSEIGRKAEQTTSVPEFLQWICQRIPSVMRYETLCIAAITLDNDVYGNAQAIDLPRQIVQGLRIGGERVGRIYIAYTEDYSFADEESALLGSIGQRVANYIETQRLTARARLLAAIVENHPDFIGVGALDGKALYVNPAGLQMAGYAPDLNVEDMNVTQFYPPSDAEVLFNEGMPAALAGGGWSNQATLLRADGSALPIEETIGVNYDDAGNAVSFSITMRDITERLLTSEAMTKQARELQIVAEVGTAAAAADDAKELLQTVVDLTQNGFGLYFSQVFLLNEAREELYLVAGAGDIGQFLVEEDSRVDLKSRKSLAAEVARNREGYVTFDVRESSDYLPHPLLPDVKSELAVPLIVGGRVLGVLNAQSDEVGYFTMADLPMYMTLATQVAVALQNVYQYEQAQQALAELQTLQRSMTREGWHTFMTAQERPIIGYRAKSDEVEAVMSGTDVATAVSTPVNILGTPIGMMGVQEPLSPENESLLQSISVQVGQALERARLAEQTQVALSKTEEQALRLAQLNEMASAISAVPTLGEVLQVAAERTNIIFAGQRASLTLLDEQTNMLQLYSLTGETGAINTGSQLPLAGTAVGAAVQENRLIVLNDLAQSTYKDVQQLYGAGLRSVMTTPLMTSRVIGTLNIASMKPNAFSQNDENLLVQVASLVATTIESRRLFNEVEERAEELAVINEVAQAVSQQLEPTRLLETVFETVQRAMLVNAFMVTSYDPATNLITYLFMYDDGQRFDIPQAPLNPNSQAYQVIQTGQPILQNYTPDELAVLQEQSIVTVGNNRLPASAMFVPLMLGTQVTGIMSVQNYEFDVYDEPDMTLLSGIANYVAVALENARLFTEVQRRAERERLVNEITRKIQGTTSMESALQTAVHELGQALQARRTQVKISSGNGT